MTQPKTRSEGRPTLSADRRAEARFDVRLPIVARWKNDASVQQASTRSRNISCNGLYFELPDQISDGATLEIVMTLPGEITGAGPVRVRYWGRVRRRETLGEILGVAVEIERYEFLRPESGRDWLSVGRES